MKYLTTRIPCTWLLAAALTPAAALADQLVMQNGDIITGDITAIADGKVTIQPAYSDPFAVNLADVASIEDDGVWGVVLGDGSEVQAQLAGAADGQQALIVENEPVSVAVSEITVLPPPPPHYERTSRADLNMTLNDGNTDSRNTLLYADTRMRFGVHRHLGDLTFAREEVNGVDTKKQDLLRYEYNRLLENSWYIGGTASYERDPIKELDHRYTVGALVGRDIFNDDVKLLTASLGAGYSDEELGGVSDSGAVGLWRLIYEHKLHGGMLAFFHNHNIDFQFYGDDNTLFKSNTGFRYDILGSLYTSVSLRYDYETEPAPGAKSYDATLAVGLGAEF